MLDALCAEHGLPTPRIEWSLRMRRMLGRAGAHPPTLRLSAWLDEAQAVDTMRHELAHLAAGISRPGRRRERPHGARWRAWALRLGAQVRAQAAYPPANAPAPNALAQGWGLECAKCGQRFARRKVLHGLYHKDCGPRAGKLLRVLRDTVERVGSWVEARPAEPAASQRGARGRRELERRLEEDKGGVESRRGCCG